MMPLSQQAQTMADAFTATLSADQRTNFNNAVANSPALVSQINAAVASGDLTGFAALPVGTNAGGQYNPTSRVMQLPLSIMSTPAAPAGARFDAGELTFVMGHEIQHAINRPTLAAAYTAFDAEVNRIGQSARAAHDYTAPLGTLLTANRNDEATANLAGYNATIGMLRSGNGGRNPTLEEIYRANPGRMQDVIAVTPGTPNTYALRAGYTQNADMTLAADAANTQAMTRHYVDMPAARARLGANGDSNYQNYYATNPVSTIARVELANAPTHAANGIRPQLQLDFTALGISEAQIERNGLDLGGAGTRQPYFDISATPPRQGNFDHTATTHRHVPIIRTEAPGHDHVAAAPERAALPAASAEAALHPAVRAALDAVDRSPNIAADAFGPDRARVAAAVALQAANEGITPRWVVWNASGTALIAGDGNLGDPASRRTTPLPLASAIATDLPVASQALDALQAARVPPPSPMHNLVDAQVATVQEPVALSR